MRKSIPLTPNTGGAVSPENTIGREKEIKEFWEILKKQSIALFAERRFGKSSILRKMEKEGNSEFLTIYKPIEGISTINNFVDALISIAKERDLIDEGIVRFLESLYNKTTELIDEAGSVKFKKLQYTWQNQLYYLFKKLIKKHDKKIIVIMLDEFSIFLSKLQNTEAASIVGFLRDISYDDEFKMIRFVYSGSIGIDLVLDKIKEKGLNIGDPLNHMHKYELEPFTENNAMYFCECLSLGCNIKIANNLLLNICERTNRIPFFIDIVFDKLGKHKQCGSAEIDEAFETILNDTKGKESIKHFCDRIEIFYPDSDISNYILNFISQNKGTSTEEEIANFVKLSKHNINQLKINKEIERLKNDGYLIRTFTNKHRVYDFKFSLLKLWWERNKAF